MKNTEAYMKNYSEKLVELLRRKLLEPRMDRQERSAIYATGKSYESLGVIDRTKGLFELVGEEYLMDVDAGGNKDVPIKELADWILAKPVMYRDIAGRPTDPVKTRGQALSLAAVMKESIMEFGTRPTPFIQKAIDEHLKNLKVVAPVVEDVRENVVDILKAAGFNLEGKTVKFV